MSKGGRALHSAHLGPAEDVSQANSDPLLVQGKYFSCPRMKISIPGEVHGKRNSQKYVEIVEKEFSEIRNSDCSKILLYSSYCFEAPLTSKSPLLKLLGHELLLSLLSQPQLQDPAYN